ncbi:hypothetical protein SDC9_171773 [bioreactor metagenome]|uniref:Uncharacterized protein n=1 Tax=bioreactor metagenome TaxID=1076179 RepID=A0A645GCH6_9ZZZZ
MSAAHAGTPLAAHGVNFVDKYDAGRGLHRLFEQVPHPGCAHAHVKLHKVRPGDGQKAHPGLTRHGLCKQGLSGAWRAHQQHALGNPGAQLGVLLRVL